MAEGRAKAAWPASQELLIKDTRKKMCKCRTIVREHTVVFALALTRVYVKFRSEKCIGVTHV